MATLKVRKLAAKQERDRRTLEAKGLRGAARLGFDLRTLSARAVRKGQPVQAAIAGTLVLFRQLMVEGMLAADLAGRLRVVSTLTQEVKQAKSFAFAPQPLKSVPSVYARAVAISKARLNFTDEQLEFLRQAYDERAAEVIDGVGDLTGDEVNQLIADAVEAGLPPVQAAKQVRAALAKAGLDPGNPYRLETIFRTQTLTAYNAARWQMLQDPDVQEILWGFEYVTAGDERVRPTHVALDGTRLPKNAQEWDSIWPPNGWNCRCTTIEIIRGDPLARKRPLRDKVIDGKLVAPTPDPGWSFNPGKAFDVPAVSGILMRAVKPGV
ncbi:hypothetical protein LCGC14_0392490 [marine sediment metagenome]|uniref:Phage head morphogenesis domain-containing protein n=1 Tax=marine sediment metagenome TaxID=412755 RepID=A0A0F9SZH1_9ZZZZ